MYGMAHVDFRTDPDRYKHWRLTVDGEVATLTMDVQEDAGLEGQLPVLVPPGLRAKINRAGVDGRSVDHGVSCISVIRYLNTYLLWLAQAQCVAFSWRPYVQPK